MSFYLGSLLSIWLFFGVFTASGIQLQSPPGEPITPQNAAQLTEFAQLKFQPWELVTAVAWSPDGAWLAVGAGDRVRLYFGEDFETNGDFRTGALSHSLHFSPDGRRLAAAGRDGVVRVWALDPDQGATLELTITAHKKGANTVRFSPDGRFLASGGNDAVARVWDTESGEEINQIIGGTFAVPSLSFSPNGASLVVVNGEVARVREAATGRMLGAFQAETSFYSLALSPDGERLAMGDGENGIWLWDAVQVFDEQVREPDPRAKLHGHTGRASSYSALVWDLAFNPDASLLASAGGDGMICLWDVESGELEAQLKAHSLGVTALAFRPDGKALVTGGLDAHIRFWGLVD